MEKEFFTFFMPRKSVLAKQELQKKEQIDLSKTTKKRTAVQRNLHCGALIGVPQCVFSCTAVQFLLVYTRVELINSSAVAKVSSLPTSTI